MNKWLGALALVLAFLTAQQVAVWGSARDLWTAALHAAPESPRPWVNLAIDAAEHGDPYLAQAYLDRALTLSDQQDAFRRAWARDVIAANQAVLDIQAGRLTLAAQRLADAPPLSKRAAVCAQFPTICH